MKNFIIFVNFLECAGSGLVDPIISNVTNCSTWAAFIESTGGNFKNECVQSSQLAIKCCFTCESKRLWKFLLWF